MRSFKCPRCGEVAADPTALADWRVTSSTLVEHVHDGIRVCAVETQVHEGELTPGGRLLRPEDFERLADEAERGYDVDEIIRRRDYPWRTREGGPARAVEEALVKFGIAGMFGGAELTDIDERYAQRDQPE